MFCRPLCLPMDLLATQQWGVHADAIGGAPAVDRYLEDALQVFQRFELHWTYWIWRRVYKWPDWTCAGFAVSCQTQTGVHYYNELLLKRLSLAIRDSRIQAEPLRLPSPEDAGSRAESQRPHASGSDSSHPGASSVSTIFGAERNVHLDIGAQESHSISPLLYSMFYEELNFGGEGGLYAELVRNRDFEALGRGCLLNCSSTRPWLRPPLHAYNGRDAHEPPPDPSDFRPWNAVGEAVLRIDGSTAPFHPNPHSLMVRVPNGARHSGVSNPGYWGISVREGDLFRLRVYVQASARLADTDPPALNLIARLVEDEHVLAETTIAPVSGHSAISDNAGGRLRDRWISCEATLMARQTANRAASLEIILNACPTSDEDCVFWLDGVSLFPSDAVGGLFRRDVFEAVQSLHPGFIRAPGGNYLEGYGERTRWNWKRTLGHWASRPGHYNAAWGYWVTDGLGLYEMLRLCELLEAPCQISVYTGYSMHAPYIPLSDSERFAQDALDLLEFANGDATECQAASDASPCRSSDLPTWRRTMGHAAPFGLKRLEVGNEERLLSDYREHYRLITTQLWAKHPHITIVASGRWLGPSIDGFLCTDNATRCDVWDEHFYQTPDELAEMGSYYDPSSYDRQKLPKVFVGEYAANKPAGTESLRASLAEAIFMLGFERNADVVIASAFAPLLNHVEGTSWPYNLINFNSSHLYVLPSYHVQQMFARAIGTSTLSASWSAAHGVSSGSTSHSAADGILSTAASVSARDGRIHIKVVNYADCHRSLHVSLASWEPYKVSKAVANLLSAPSPDARNSLSEPQLISPKPWPIVHSCTTCIQLELPPWSLVVLTVELAPGQP